MFTPEKYSFRWIPRIRDLLSSHLNSSSPAISTQFVKNTNNSTVKDFILPITPLSDSFYPHSPNVRSLLKTNIDKLNLKMEQNTIEDIKKSQILSKKSTIFCNNYVNMEDVKIIGFDLDYTLVQYTSELQDLIYNLTKEKLIEHYGFPKELKNCFYDSTFAIRGLSVDLNTGVLVKLNHIQRIGSRYAYYGKNLLNKDELEELYGPFRYISFNNFNKLRPISDMFALAEACLISDCIDVYNKIYDKNNFCCDMVINDIQEAIRDVHISGLLHNNILQNKEKYIFYNQNLLSMLKYLKKNNKKLFLCTNSNYRFLEGAFSYATDLKENEDWKDLFDVIICSAQKPDFFKSKKQFRKWNTLIDRPSAAPVNPPPSSPYYQKKEGQDEEKKSTEIWVGGSAYALQKLFPDWNGKNVIYIGDNIRSDLVEARRYLGWHTGSIINELGHEIDIQNSEFFNELHYVRSILKLLINDLQTASFKYKKSIESKNEDDIEIKIENPIINPQIESEKEILFTNEDPDEKLIKLLEKELVQVNAELSSLFNRNFGSIFRTDGHPSLYALDIKRYADIYMGDVTCFKNYSPNHRFYPLHGLHMAHDPASCF